MRLRVVRVLAAREVRTSVRGRWFLIGAIAFAALSVAVAHLGLAGAGRWGVSALDRTSVALLNLVLLFVPLMTLPLGVASFAGEAEDGALGYLVAQPVTRGEVFAGKLTGLVLAMTLSLALGFGVAAIFTGWRGGVGTRTFATLGLGAWLLGVVMVTLGAAISVLARGRARALAAVMGTWLVLVFLCDFGVLALASAHVTGPGTVFAVSVANPLSAVKTLVALSASARLEVLGPAGIHAVHVLGRAGLAFALVAALAGWVALAGGGAYAVFRRENLS